MFIYKIFNTLSDNTYLYGITVALNNLLKINPEWSYLLINNKNTQQEEVHLTIIDFTSYEKISEITKEEEKLIQEEKGYKTLVLLNSEQSALAYTLHQFYTCSLFCVDELHFHIRELIEHTLKKRRFTSAMIVKMVEKHIQSYRDIKFTAAEMLILSGLYSGKTAVKISNEIFRSQKTISSHKRRIMKKLGAEDELSLKIMMDEIDYENDKALR
ncbi:helix-turn-helix domain-containing protein [Enterobacter quasiroggenkampii]|uniref:helix-turn-helix domain-containing protein n=1 Tax=Enterobacter quasiroggenkampii TaxID=2497436 RepID=UPI0021D32B3F|nr:helix-turn-helix transcriptional regulator [Enterobacter quasiroggenkampii]MCU6306624.1 helix-turn-helix transcriptional regulator [Enterobacter quasiroggenkampii]